MKVYTRNAIGTFQECAKKSLNGSWFTSWRTPDNKHFYLVPSYINPNIPKYGMNPEHYEVTYTLLGTLDMVK